jgi:hypothetical protein
LGEGAERSEAGEGITSLRMRVRNERPSDDWNLSFGYAVKKEVAWKSERRVFSLKG